MQKVKFYNKSSLAVPMPTFQLKGTVSVTCAFSLESYVWYFTLNSGTIFHLLIGNHNHFCSVLLCFLYLWSALNCQIFKAQSCPDKGTTSVPALLRADLPQSESWLPSVAKGSLLERQKPILQPAWEQESSIVSAHIRVEFSSQIHQNVCILYWKGEILEIDANLLQH